jgi:predicted metalloprotease with PDZ domain
MPSAHYRVVLDSVARKRHEVQVELTLTGLEPGVRLRLMMAAWCPGSYLIRDYARFVSGLEAEDSSGALAIGKDSKSSWVVEPGDSEMRLSYTVYGYELSVRTNFIDENMVFLHGPATWIYAEGQGEATVVVQGEHADETLESLLPDQGSAHAARDVDELLDSPILLGCGKSLEFRAGDAEHRIFVVDAPRDSSIDLARLRDDMQKICQGHVERFGESAPFSRYTFLLMLSAGAYGGLEHACGSANLHSPRAFFDGERYRDLVELLSHEYVHAWNGKRMRPAAFHGFDYQQENYTRTLWMIEGVTSYLDRRQLVLAGVLSPKKYLEKVLTDWARLRATPGRFVHSLEEASFDAWIKAYKPDAHNVNSSVSYYLLGGIAMLALDLVLRRGGSSLDMVLNGLWRRFADAGYPESLAAAFSQESGQDLEEWFSQHISGRDEIDLAGALEVVGLALEEEGPATPWLGALVHPGGVVRSVLAGGPSERAGLSPGDQIIAIDDLRCGTDGAIRTRLSQMPVSRESFSVTVFRRQRLKSLPFDVEAAPPRRFRITVSKQAGKEEARRRAEWLGQEESELVAVAAKVPWI